MPSLRLMPQLLVDQEMALHRVVDHPAQADPERQATCCTRQYPPAVCHRSILQQLLCKTCIEIISFVKPGMNVRPSGFQPLRRRLSAK